MTEQEIQTIIYLLRNSVRPTSHAKLMDDAASALADCKYAAMLWEAFEDFGPIDKGLIDATEKAVIDHTEGNANLAEYAAAGAWDIIFELFLEEVKGRLLQLGRKSGTNAAA